MELGRPTKLTKEVRQKADGYLHWCNENNEVPSAVGLALFLDVSKKTLYNWIEQDKAFLHTFSKVQGEQERLLLKNGLNNTYNSTITKLMLANHGYSDRQAVDHTTKGDKIDGDISDEQIRRIIEARTERADS